MSPEPKDVQVMPDEVVDQTATVVSAEAMDEKRVDEVKTALSTHWDVASDRLSRSDDAPSDVSGWKHVAEDLVDAGEETLATKVDTLTDRVDRPYPSLLRLRLHLHERALSFDPGQYVRISFEDGPPRVYSIASSPNDAELELCITRVPGGHLTPTLMDETDRGDELFVRGPYAGDLSLRDESGRDMVFVATGAGVSPLRSMIRYTFEEGLDEHDGEPRDVWLVLGSSWRDDLPYYAEFAALDDKREHFHFVPTLSREPYLSWDGETAYVQRTLVKYLADKAVDRDVLPDVLCEYLDEEPAYDIDTRIDPENAELYLCGVGAMCDSVTDVTQRLDLDERFVEVESYG